MSVLSIPIMCEHFKSFEALLEILNFSFVTHKMLQIKHHHRIEPCSFNYLSLNGLYVNIRIVLPIQLITEKKILFK